MRSYWPALPDHALAPGYTGIRPKISGPREPAADFMIAGPADHGVPGLVNLFGIESRPDVQPGPGRRNPGAPGRRLIRPSFHPRILQTMQHNDYILTLSCPDRTGIVYRVSGLLFELGCNILDSQQFGDDETGRFFLRVHFDLPSDIQPDALRARLDTLSAEFGMDPQLHDARRKARLLIMVSKQGHCLNDLLFRVHSGQLRAEVAAIVSNHNDYAPLAATYGILPPPARHARHQGAARTAGAGPGRPASTSTWWCWPATCRSCRRHVPRAERPRHQHPPQLPAQLQGARAPIISTRAA